MQDKPKNKKGNYLLLTSFTSSAILRPPLDAFQKGYPLTVHLLLRRPGANIVDAAFSNRSGLGAIILDNTIAERRHDYGDVPTFVEKRVRRAGDGDYAACGLWASAGGREDFRW